MLLAVFHETPKHLFHRFFELRLRIAGSRPSALSARARKRCQLHAVVIMPDQVHLLPTPLRDKDGWQYGLPVILKLLKGTSPETEKCGTDTAVRRT
jgi:REP element-mobilizing transposase RayT